MKLQLQNLTKQYKNSAGIIAVLKPISLSIANHEIVCIVGPSGCGKSTLLNIIAGLESPNTGSVTVDGTIGFIFQDATLFPWLSVYENIAFGLKLSHKEPQFIQQTVSKLITLTKLAGFEYAFPHQLSGGMKQRVSLARTLAINPSILLMDEPFAALDALTREEMYEEIQRIAHITHKTILFVTHNVREAVCLGDRVVVLTNRPGTIKKEFSISIPRPRNINTAIVSRLSRRIYDELVKDHLL